MIPLDVTDHAIAASLAGFVPERIFDVHAHLYRVRDLGGLGSDLLAALPEKVGVACWREAMAAQVGDGRLEGGLFMPWPARGGDVDAANAYLVEQVGESEACRGLVLVTPDSARETVEALLDHPGVIGLKPYHCYAGREPTFQAPLADYLPEWAWDLAHARGLVLMVHLVRDRALADPANYEEIQRMGARHPNAKLVLAHAARGFHAPNTVAAIEHLRGLENVWFDTSAVCEPAALLAILRAFGPRKLLWGSDFPVSHQRGRCVTVGDGFAWVAPDRVDTGSDAPACHPTLVGLESLRALAEAADLFGLNQGDLEDIFHGNARRLLEGKGLQPLVPDAPTATADLYRHAKTRIPGGTHLLSKRPEMFAPDQWPAYFREARGCEVWDLDGRHYYDLSVHGIGACLLGFRDPDVTRAVQRRVQLGSMCTLNPPEEVELADRLCAIHSWADQVRLTRGGGEAAVVAVRIARATTRRSLVAFCGYHGWHDWYLAANLGENDALVGHLLPGLDPHGVPVELRGTTLTFPYNRPDAFEAILEAHGDRLAAVVMEPVRRHHPDPGFLEFVRDGAHRCGALLIFDEITVGWRLTYGGAHLTLGVAPDMALFAKALGNGHPIGAVIGAKAAMEGAHESFISSTYWTEGVGPAAALATLDKMAQIDVPAHVHNVGRRVQDAWCACGEEHGLPVVVEDVFPCLAHFAFEHDQAAALDTLYTQEMLARGFLAGPAIYPCLAHTDAIVARYEEAVDAVFAAIAEAIASDTIHDRLRGPVAHQGFRRLV